MKVPCLPIVKNMVGNFGHVVRNQFIINTEDGTFFQSYDTIIAWITNEGKVILDERSWNCSKTTGKYRNNFLGEDINATRNRIESGAYQFQNLNPERKG